MDHFQDVTLPEPPEGYRWHDTLHFGFAIAVPRRFHLITNSADPLARLWRHADEVEAEGRSDAAGGAHVAAGPYVAAGPHDPTSARPWPLGLWDPQVIGELPDGRAQPLRLFECDVIGGRDEPMPPDDASQLWFQARQMLSSTLEYFELPGYRLLDVHDTTLGDLDALAFEYRWDGLCDFEGGGDHGLLVWAPSSWLVFHVYHHCPESQWAARRPELDQTLASFRLLDTEDQLEFEA